MAIPKAPNGPFCITLQCTQCTDATPIALCYIAMQNYKNATLWACSTSGHPWHWALVLPCLYYIVVQRSHRALGVIQLVLPCITLYYSVVHFFESIGCTTRYYKKNKVVLQKGYNTPLTGMMI